MRSGVNDSGVLFFCATTLLGSTIAGVKKTNNAKSVVRKGLEEVIEMKRFKAVS